MSNRRMFSNRIANSAKFLQMPTESQLLYFHMVLRADDDGVVESYPLLKLLSVPTDNFKILIAKGFIEQLNEDQVVVIIDWLEHNSIRADRKVDSIYKDLIVEKLPTLPLVMPKPRSDVEDNSKRVGGQSTVGISKVKLSQVKSSKDKIINTNTLATPAQEAISFFEKGETYHKLLSIFSLQADKPLLEKEFNNFILYWTERNKTGTKQKWQQQDTFEVKRRLYTWLSRSTMYQKTKLPVTNLDDIK